MQVSHKKPAQIVLITSVLCIGMLQAYADDVPDPYQNSGSNNIAYDLPSKWYVGGNLGYSILSDNTVTSSNQNTRVDSNSMDFGLFGGYKFNHYFSLETNFERLAHIKNKRYSPFLLSYSANVYNLSLEGLVSYPVISSYQYTASLYGKAGYGINFTNYSDHVDFGATKQSGNLNQGAYNFGLGVNVDFRPNISARLDYTYYQAFYSLPGHGKAHNANVFTLGMYYNFT